MRFLIATGIYPPEIGGPAYYAKNLADALRAKGHEVEIGTFGKLKTLPIGIRHIALFFKLIPGIVSADKIIALDTFSAALPAYFAATLFQKHVIVRTGGDFLWEQYIERTGDLVPLPFFYDKHRPFTLKEKIYFSLTKFLLSRVTLVFSTNFQKDIWVHTYGLDEKKLLVIPNAITGVLEPIKPIKRNFMIYGRDIQLRNRAKLREAFTIAKEKVPEIELEEGQVPQHVLFDRIRAGYCVVLPSITDISPNFILDGLRAGKPFVMTKYSEYAKLYSELGLFIDPLDIQDIASKIIAMADESTYNGFVEKIKATSFSRTYADLADDFLALANKV
jgi:glycosyltransferase involved in cell wall biosynthesis